MKVPVLVRGASGGGGPPSSPRTAGFTTNSLPPDFRYILKIQSHGSARSVKGAKSRLLGLRASGQAAGPPRPRSEPSGPGGRGGDTSGWPRTGLGLASDWLRAGLGLASDWLRAGLGLASG